MAIGGLGGSDDSVLSIKTGDTKFLVIRATGTERLGRLPEFAIDVVGDLDKGKIKDIDLNDLMGIGATLTMNVQDTKRYFGGHIVRVERGDRHGRYQSYRLTVRPWLWFLTRTKNYRVFQEKDVKDIIEEVLKDYSGAKKEFRLNATYVKRDYCVQYNETDFDFLSRLMEEEGIYYFFEHGESDHTMVMIDKMMSHKSKKGEGPIHWATDLKYESTIVDWRTQEDARSAKVVVADHDYLATTTKIEANKPATKEAKKKIGKMEVYDYPTDVVQNSVKEETKPSTAAATARAGVRIEELTSMQVVASGTTNERDVAAGATFKLDKCPWDDDNTDYLVVSAKYDMEFAQHEAVQDLKDMQRRGHGFEATLLAIRKDKGIFRPERSTPRPIVPGPETALVVGASGNEIETDKHGRIKIQFFWDRLGKNDQTSSCFVRVATAWAGKGFGAFALPRVGNEVVVSFLGGNPDRPLVTGSVYNDANLPPWEMPKHKTVSGVKTQSTKGGSATTNNELRFEDEKDKEYIWLQAQKDFYRHVTNDAFDLIDKNETVKVTEIRKAFVGKSQFVEIGEDWQTKVAKDLHLDIGGDQIIKIAGANQLQVGKAYDMKIGGDLGFDVTGAVGIKASGAVVIDAPSGITLKCGGSTVNLSSAGVDIVGSMVKINSGGGGGSASPGKPADPKKPEALKDDDFKDPMTKS
jgi:type VI secretion system secreted protein VgrG